MPLPKNSAQFNAAVASLKNVVNVDQWNLVREHNKSYLTQNEMNRIDQSGMIVQVLGQDPVYVRRDN